MWEKREIPIFCKFFSCMDYHITMKDGLIVDEKVRKFVKTHTLANLAISEPILIQFFFVHSVF